MEGKAEGGQGYACCCGCDGSNEQDGECDMRFTWEAKGGEEEGEQW